MCNKHHHHHHRGYGRHRRRRHHRHGGGHPPFSAFGAPVNIRELDDRYELHLIAPGLSREDFTLEIADDQLMVTANTPEATMEGQWQRREYRFGNFERSFQLSDKIDSEAITAAYEAGVLRIALPKNPDRVTQRRALDIE